MQIIDVRNSEGQLAVIGGSLALPTSEYDSSTSTLSGSLRWNVSKEAVEFYNNSDWQLINAIRSVPFPMIGVLQNAQQMNITLTQTGTLIANGGTPQAYIGTLPTATQYLTLKTIHSGTIVTQGTVTVSTTGSVTFPSFAAVSMVPGDTIQLLNQATADASFANACISFQFEVTA